MTDGVQAVGPEKGTLFHIIVLSENSPPRFRSDFRLAQTSPTLISHTSGSSKRQQNPGSTRSRGSHRCVSVDVTTWRIDPVCCRRNRSATAPEPCSDEPGTPLRSRRQHAFFEEEDLEQDGATPHPGCVPAHLVRRPILSFFPNRGRRDPDGLYCDSAPLSVPHRVPVLRAARRFRLGMPDPERLHRPLRRTRPPRFGQSSFSWSGIEQPG